MNLQPYTREPDIQRLFSAFKRKKVDRVPNFEVLVRPQREAIARRIEALR